MSANKNHENGTILMSFMFRGNYLRENLGHEIINLFKADNGKHYIYVNPWGQVNEKDFGKIETILLVRCVGNHKVKIIAKAWELSDPYSGVLKNNQKKLDEIKKGQMIKCKNIEYGGKKLVDIFKFAEKNDKQKILVSFEAGNFRRAKENLYVDFSDKDKSGNMPSHSLRGYYPFVSEDDKEDKPKKNMYRKLKEIINNDVFWEDRDQSDMISSNELKPKFDINFLNVIGKEDDELAFSNWFHYLFNNDKQLLIRFAEKVLGLKRKLTSQAKVQREIGNIDLLISDPKSNQLVVIENKIKSGINGNQLSKYKKVACEIIEKYGLSKETKPDFFIFLPVYSLIKEDICKQSGYEIVKYSEICEFFEQEVIHLNNNKKKIGEEERFNNFVLTEFSKALVRHKSDCPDHLFEDTYRLFRETIAKT